MMFIQEFLNKWNGVGVFLILVSFSAQSQNPTTSLQLETQAIGTTKNQVPFWFRSRQEGSVPMAGVSGSVVGRFERDYFKSNKKFFDWGVGLEGRVNGGGEGADLLLIQANAKIKLGVLELRGGRWRHQVGLLDTLLSSGSFSISGNALGIPQIQLSIPEFSPVPFTNQWVAVKGSISHGWLGEQAIGANLWADSAITYFHHKSLYVRIGQNESRVRLYGGINHQAFWGNERRIFGATFTLTRWQSYQSVLYGRNWAGSKVGNHLGTVDVGVDINFFGSGLLLYKQSFYDAGGLAHLSNITDGLYGLSVKNKEVDRGGGYFRWSRVLLEFLYTKSQGGSLSSKATPTGAEDYYNHYLYANGWSYAGADLGSPLITPATDAKAGQASEGQHYINNRLFAFHGGLEGAYGEWKFRVLATFSKNYGTWETSGEPFRTPFYGINNGLVGEKFRPVNQFSTFLSIKKISSARSREPGKRRLFPYWGVDVALDRGELLNHSFGAMARYGVEF